MKNFSFKKVLFLENENWDEDLLPARFKHEFEQVNIECKVIDYAFHKLPEVIEGINWCDAVLFQSTFIYGNQVKAVGDLFAKIKEPKIIFGIVGGFDSLQKKIEDLWTLKELAAMAHHKLYVPQHYVLEEDDWIKEEIDLTQYKKEFDHLEKERYEKTLSFPKTGRKVLIKNISTTSGSQWSLLKKGDIVDELDCHEIDPNPNRGIWVMGKDEPIKLLNEGPYEEWEFADLKCDDIVREFFIRANKANDPEYQNYMDFMTDWVYKCISPLQTNESELWTWCTELLDELGLPRRKLRQILYDRLVAYRDKYCSFKEPNH